MNEKQKLIDWLEAALEEAEEQRAFYDREVNRLRDALQGAMDTTGPEAKEQKYFLRDIKRDYLTE